MDNGWYRASCNVTIPDGVSLLRSFEIADINGDWESLEIRKHRIRLVSDSISEAKYTDTVTLETLADNQTTLAATLEELEVKEIQEKLLLKEKQKLEFQIAAFNAKNKTAQEIARLKKEIEEAKSEEQRFLSEYYAENENPLNYYCKIKGKQSDKFLDVKGWGIDDGSLLNIYEDNKNLKCGSDNQIWELIPTGNGFFKIKGKQSGKLLSVIGLSSQERTGINIQKDCEHDNQIWELIPITDGFFKIKSKGSKYFLDVNNWNTQNGTLLNIYHDNKDEGQGNVNQLWKLEKTSEKRKDNNISTVSTKLKHQHIKLSEKETEKANLEQVLKANEQEKEKWNALLAQLSTKITEIQNEIGRLNATFLEGVNNTQKPQSMPKVPNDGKGLVTQGALLGFVNPASRLNAIETCEGNVQLSYFDIQGRMRQTLYDATVDNKNTTNEQWIPDAQRACLNLNQSKSVVKLNQPLGQLSDWTIEAWFVYPLPVTGQGNTLAKGQNGGCHIAVRPSKELGTQLGIVFPSDGDNSPVLGFYDSGFNMEWLSQGWHHLAVVGRGDTTLFYIDGKKVGDTKAKFKTDPAIQKKLDDAKKKLADAKTKLNKTPNDNSAKQQVKDIEKEVTNSQKEVDKIEKATLKVTSPVDAIGNTKDGGQQFGKLAEVRIWGVALSDEEIAVNSKTLLSGNEPGLLAYYPMNEATGLEIRDHSWKEHDGEKHHGTVSNECWWGCTAPIGNLENTVMNFDGVKDHISLPDMNHDFSQGFTVEAWVWYDSFKPWSRIIDFGNGSCADNIVFANSDTSNTLYFGWCVESKYQFIDKEGVLETGKWMHLAATIDTSGNAKLYKNGQLIHTGEIKLPQNIKRTNNCIGKSNWFTGSNFNGKISDVRIWQTARTQAEIQADMYKRLSGKEQNLVAYYPLNEIKREGSTQKVSDQKVSDLVGNNHGTVTGAITVDSNTLPIGRDALVCNEYSSVTLEGTKKVALMRRFFASPATNGVTLLPDKRIEALERIGIGNGQFAPTLLGYIEGPPPVPSENLTVKDDYNGATSIELTVSQDVKFSWKRSEDSGSGGKLDGFVGADTEAHAGVVATAKIAEGRAGLKGNADFSWQSLEENNITAGSSLSMTDKLELRGTAEETAKFKNLGKRFIPKNIGYALVVSAIADVYVTRLKRSGKMVSQQVKPVDGIPPDVNTITFLINPAYTMNGSLDGLTGSSATTDRFFKHVPEMRSQYGSLYPASYYRLQEAYELKRQIEAEDKRRESYFYNFDARSRTELHLHSAIHSGDAPTPVGLEREEDKTDTNMTKAEEEQAQVEKKKAAEAQFKKEKAETAAKTKEQETAVKQRLGEIQSRITDKEKQVQASDSLVYLQKWMEAILIRAGKRNIVNTYVWDGDGGLRSEAQSFANTVEHTIGGSFIRNEGLGFEGKYGVGGFKAELTLQGTGNLTQTTSKTEARSNGFQLNVKLDGLEYKGITDYNDNPILPGEKVDRYRFMSFYLEGSTKNFQDFFNYVVDPEWLQSNGEEARALRQAQAGKPNKAWRVLHRVTYVERPALMGFGRDVRKVRAAAESDKLADVLSKVKDLENKNKKLEEKIDTILEWVKLQEP